jgi:pSer/pThr/pTyr-binding forkhead associated (FHA) protein
MSTKSTISQTPSTPTQKFSKSFSGTMKSLIGSKGRTYFILEHKTQTSKHKIGETVECIGDYIEIGRGNNYAINFGDDCTTVSRPHAAILRQDEGWAIKHLSGNNPTLLNDQPLQGQKKLYNGDQIQLSYEGPKLIFLIPTNNSVGTMGMTVRLKAMTREALRPYRYAVMTLCSLILLGSLGGYYLYTKMFNQLTGIISETKTELLTKETELDKLKIVTKEQADQIVAINKKNEALIKKIGQIRIQTPSTPPSTNRPNANNTVDGSVVNALSPLYSSVFFIKTEKIVLEIDGKLTDLKDDDGNLVKLSGTGFLLNNGKFVTARHVITPWVYPQDKSMINLNIVAENGGKFIHYFVAKSINGEIRFSSEDFVVNDSEDQVKQFEDEESGNTFLIRLASYNEDWAVANTNKRGVIVADLEGSCSLPAASKLHILGYPLGIGGGDTQVGKPTYSECSVGRDGCPDGFISVTDQNIDHGNSGGPVFYMKDNQMFSVGIVSAMRGNAQGVVIPLKSIR